MSEVNINKKITVEEFVSAYKSRSAEKSQEALIKTHIVNRYVPYEEKCNICQKIVDSTMKIEKGNAVIFHQDTTARYMLYCLKMIDLYTDIFIDFKKSLDCFNALDQYDLLDAIIKEVPHSECEKINTILKMKVDDFRENERSTASYMSKLFRRVAYTIDTFTEIVNNALDEETISKLRSKFAKK